MLLRTTPSSVRKFAEFRRFAAVALLLAVALACVSLAVAQQSKRSKNRAKAPATPAPPAAAPVPFRSGEILEYRVLFSKYAVNAAKIETTIVEQRNFFGHPAWHFRASAHTMDTTRVLFAIDDQFDSYTSAANLFSLQYEMYLHEQGKEQTSVYRMTGDNDPAPSDATALRVTPGTRDAISFLYNLRAADWQRSPELKAPVFDGRRLYDAIARIDTPQGNISVPAGNFPAFRVAIRLFDHGKELTDTRLWLWIATNAAHTPVLAEAEIPFGTARIELTQLP
ncbi:MAG TPA: DUF3108 domain-containing protein [Candidatus Acidoferrales bacterium]|nr:DUF3108 domain-containing protein [Candidatus Acidoferrales bacterium]